MEMSIENIATKMRVLASEIGGNHHSLEEVEDLLNNLADELSEINMNMSMRLHNAIDEADEASGINDSYRFLYQRQKNIKENEDGKIDADILIAESREAAQALNEFTNRFEQIEKKYADNIENMSEQERWKKGL